MGQRREPSKWERHQEFRHSSRRAEDMNTKRKVTWRYFPGLAGLAKLGLCMLFCLIGSGTAQAMDDQKAEPADGMKRLFGDLLAQIDTRKASQSLETLARIEERWQ